LNSIFIHDLRVETRIGVYEWEAKLSQTIRLDVEIGLPSDNVFQSGDFADALDYAAVVKRLQAFATDHPHKLLERFAQAIADMLLAEFAAPWVKVRVAKIAPIAGVRELGVAIERKRVQ
jgi:dihydroneopterin aldolase